MTLAAFHGNWKRYRQFDSIINERDFDYFASKPGSIQFLAFRQNKIRNGQKKFDLAGFWVLYVKWGQETEKFIKNFFRTSGHVIPDQKRLKRYKSFGSFLGS